MIAKELISELEKIHERYIPENNQRLNSANTRLGLLAFPADVFGERKGWLWSEQIFRNLPQSARDEHEPPPFLSLQAPRGHQYFANFWNQGWEPQRGEKVRGRMRFVKKPGGKRRSWHAQFFPYVEKENVHDIVGYDA